MIEHLLSTGFSVAKWVSTTDTWGGEVEKWSTAPSSHSGYLSHNKGGLTFRVGQDDKAIDAVCFTAHSSQITEGDRLTDPDGINWKILHAPKLKTPLDGRGFMELKLELMR